MNVPVVKDEKDPKWALLGKILAIIMSRRVKQEMAKQGIKPVDMAGAMLKIVFIAMFFSEDIPYVVEEVKKRKELRCLHTWGRSRKRRRSTGFWLWRVGHDMCQKMARRGVSGRFNRYICGSKLVLEKDKKGRFGRAGV